MNNHDKIKDIASDQIALKGKNSKKKGILTRFQFTPNAEFRALTKERQNQVVDTTLSSQLWEHCKKIGWWPDNTKAPYKIELQEDGTYVLIAFLIKGIGGKSIDVEGIIGVNEQ